MWVLLLAAPKPNMHRYGIRIVSADEFSAPECHLTLRITHTQSEGVWLCSTLLMCMTKVSVVSMLNMSLALDSFWF